MPERPLVLFDGNCGFCRTWIDYFQALIGTPVDYAPTEEIAPKSVRIRLPDGQDFSGAKAVLEMLRYAPGLGWLAWVYEKVPLFAIFSEWAYRVVADHRPFFDKVTRLFFGRPVLPSTYVFIEWLFIRALALVYLIAFVSFGPQVRGLIGSHGILPVHSYLQALTDTFGLSRYWLVPTVLWLRSRTRLQRSEKPFTTSWRSSKEISFIPPSMPKSTDEAGDLWQGRVNRSWRFYFLIQDDTYIITNVISHPK